MLKKFLKHPYIIGGILAFLILFFVGVFALEVTVGESMFGSAVLTIVGVGGVWWKEKVWP
jgi:hypothetical protein